MNVNRAGDMGHGESDMEGIQDPMFANTVLRWPPLYHAKKEKAEGSPMKKFWSKLEDLNEEVRVERKAVALLLSVHFNEKVEDDIMA